MQLEFFQNRIINFHIGRGKLEIGNCIGCGSIFFKSISETKIYCKNCLDEIEKEYFKEEEKIIYSATFREKVIEHEILIITYLPFEFQELKNQYGYKLEKKK